MHPDFVFFQEVRSEIRATIVDPHGHHLDDSEAKLRALAGFAAKYGPEFHRVEAVAELEGRMRALDMQSPIVRETVIRGGTTAKELYLSNVAIDYG